MAQPKYTIKKRLLLLISMPILMLSVGIGAIALSSVYEEIAEVYDAQLVHSAKVLLQLVEKEVQDQEYREIELGAERPELFHQYEKNITFRIWKHSHLITQSHQAESFGKFQVPPGFSNQDFDSEKWRFFVFADDRTGITIEVAEKEGVRTELIYKILAALFIPLSLFIPLFLLIIWFGVSRSLRPVILLSQSVDKRDINDLSIIEESDAPEEIHPLIRALNRLLARIQESFDRERQFTDNAAHELRTPLAAMKTQAQVLLKKAADMPECQEGLNNLHSSINRATHLVDQLLSFARLQSHKIEKTDVDLSAVVNEVLQDLSVLALNDNKKLEANIDDHELVRGNKEALSILVRNLVDNALKYTPAGGRINVLVFHDDGNAVFEVSDTGKGISDNEKEKVFNRFYRSNKSEGHGSGLGLSIAKWICDIHGAQITLKDNHPKGLIVQVTIPELFKK